jgi:hypothetical protein
VATDRENIELAFNIELETRRAMGAISKIDKQLRKTVSSKLQIKAFDSKSLRDFNRQLVHSKSTLRAIAFSMSPKQRKKFDKDFQDMGKAYKGLTKLVSTEHLKIQKLERKLRKTSDKEQKQALEEKLKQERKSSSKLIRIAQRDYTRKRSAFGKKLVTTGTSAHLEKRAEAAKASQEFIEGIKSHKTGAELAEGFKDAVSSMAGKDIFGLAKAGGRVSGSLLKGFAKMSMAKGAGIAAKGKEMGGLTGGALKGIGGAMKGIGPLLGSLSKLGPILGMVGSALFALVKLFLDADAAVKEMNRTVLEGGSTWDTYAASGRDVEAGMGNLDKSLRRLRDETTDLEMNFKMGTTAKDHQQVINTLEREGVTLNKLTVSFSKYTDISKQSIVYSRLFGVSVEEIAQMQAEMMQQMGAGLNDLGKEFDLIGRAAEDSGIAQNKFFAMLRGVSSDLALYGVRIGETTKMLGQLGKVMSPRTAQKFLTEFAKGFKGKSIQDRLKAMLLGGPAAIKAIQDDISGQLKDLVTKVSDATGIKDEKTVRALLAGKTVGGQSMRKLEKTGKIQGAGAMIEAFQKLEMAAKQSKQGVYGAAQAAETAGGYAAYKAQKAGLRIGGAKTFTQASMMGAPGHQAAIMAAGGNEETLDAFIGIERAIEQQKNDLVGAIDDPDGEKDVIAVLKKLKKYDEKAAQSDKNYLKNQVASLTEDELWKSLDEKNAEKSMTQAEKDAKAMREMAEQQGQRTQDILSKLDLIFDALYNRIYGVVLDIANTLSLKFGKGGAIRESALSSKSSDVISSWTAGGGDVGKFMGALSGSATAKSLDTMLHSTDKKDYANKAMQKTSIASVFQSGSLTGDVAKDLADALKESGVGGSDAQRILSAQKSGKSIEDAISSGGLTEKAEADLYSKMALWFTSAAGRQAIIEGVPKMQALAGTVGGGAGVAPATSPAAPSAQQQASAKSENPGTGGAAVPVAASPAPTTTAATATPAGGGGFFTPPMLPDEQKMNDAVMDQVDFTGNAVVNNLQDLWKAMRMKGIKLDKVQLKGEYQDVIYKGAQQALFEYALYTAQDPASTLKKMKDSGFGGLGAMADTFQKQQELAKGSKQDTLLFGPGGNAAGGIVTGINGGIANVNPAPGEGLTSIGRGERILPAGAGGGAAGDIHLHVDGLGGADLANFLKGEIARGVHEYKRREKFS